MSQVLIGIIGVILFIGLALAGAMFLGPRFQESANNSRASATLQAVAQVSQAANMFRLQEGYAAPTVAALGTQGYLKATPVNPVENGTAPTLVDLLDSAGASGTDTVMDHVRMRIGQTSDSSSLEICKAINKQATGYVGDPPVTAPPSAVAPLNGVSGCYTSGTDIYAFARV